MSRGDYKKSLNEARTVLDYFVTSNNKTKIAYCYFLIGKAEFFLDHLDSAMVHFMKGIDAIQNIDCIERALLYDCVGKLLFNADQDSKALYYYLQAEEITKKFKDTTEQIYNQICIADVYVDLKKNDLHI